MEIISKFKKLGTLQKTALVAGLLLVGYFLSSNVLMNMEMRRTVLGACAGRAYVNSQTVISPVEDRLEAFEACKKEARFWVPLYRFNF